MKVHAVARRPHLMEHLAPIFRNLPDSLRGQQILEHNVARAHLKHLPKNDVIMVAGYPDAVTCEGWRTVYVEHGAAQRYEGANERAAKHYHGSEHPEHVVAYIGPRQDVIDSWGRLGVAVGSPICDPYELFSPERVAAITFHWAAGAPHRVGVPEAGNAFEHFQADMKHVVAELRVNGWEVIGTRHPQFNAMRGFWERLGVPAVSADEVRRRAQLLIADNTSLMYEMLYLSRAVVAMNAPEWRRDVEHGLRFWKHAPAAQVDSPIDLIDLIPNLDKMIDRGEISERDMRTTQYVYGKAFSDGHDGLRGATWLTSFLGTL